MMSWIWKVSSTRPWPVSEDSDSSATRWAKAARSRMICSTDIEPTIERSAPARTSWVKVSISACWLRKRWPAARIESSLPPTLTIATPSRLSLMPCPETAPRICTEMRRRGQVEGREALHERDDEHAAAHDDLLAGQVGGDLAGLRVAHLALALAPGDDERLVGPGHLVARGDQHRQQHQQEDEAGHSSDDRGQSEHGQCSLRWCGGVRGGVGWMGEDVRRGRGARPGRPSAR